MTDVSIIGSGTMGQAIAAAIGRGGSPVQVLGSSDAGTPVTGEIVVLAVPHAAVESIITSRADELAGKIVVDITNPVDFATFDSLVVPADASAATAIAAALPDSKVLKAFNTNFAATLASGVVGEVPTTVLIAGDDTEAKDALSAVLIDGGLRSIDAGSLRRARELEALGFLQITLAAGEKLPWTTGFAVIS